MGKLGFVERYQTLIAVSIVLLFILNIGTGGTWVMGDFDWGNIWAPLATTPPPAADDDDDPPPPPPPADDPLPPPPPAEDETIPYFGYSDCEAAAIALSKEYYFATPGDLESCYEWGFNYCTERGWWISNYNWAPPNCCVFNCGGD